MSQFVFNITKALQADDDSARLTLFLNDGKNLSGFGWEWLGFGLSTGGRWYWEYTRDNTKPDETKSAHYHLALIKPGEKRAGIMHNLGKWEVAESLLDEPPEPWFEQMTDIAGRGTIRFEHLKGLVWHLI